jgi:hypothetical protein
LLFVFCLKQKQYRRVSARDPPVLFLPQRNTKSNRSLIGCSFVDLLALQAKAKSSGLPDNNFIFFVATKKTKQKKTWALRLACLACYHGNINFETTDYSLSTDPP